jgi:hypothetical protein
VDALRSLTDRLAVYDLVVRYATALDTRDWAMLSSCFVPDAVAEYPNGTFTGYPAIEANCRRALLPLDASQHIVTNHWVEFADGAARSRCYLHAQHVRYDAPGGEVLTLGASYEDDVINTDDGWRIRRRRLHSSWVQGNAAIFDEARARSGWTD